MSKRISIASVVLAAVAALLSVLLAAAVPALAATGNGKANGHAKQSARADKAKDGDASTAYTEDNDTNDGNTPNNVSDDGDNRHPSGKDRSVENGNSGNQGNAQSHPDDSKGPMRYEGEQGADKPNGPGGTDLADQDGNNGCGNDDDFDDDNNGWCGRHKSTEDTEGDEVEGDTEESPSVQPTPCEGEMVEGSEETQCGSVDTPENTDVPPVVEGEIISKCEDESTMGSTTSLDCDTSVLGERVTAEDTDVAGSGLAAERPATRGGVLPFTGGSVVIFLIVALALLGIGAALLRTRRS